MTNVLLLPAFSSQSQFTVPNNADWNDGILFSAPGSPTAAVTQNGQLTALSSTAVIQATNAILTGMPIAIAPGIPGGAFVGSILDSVTFQMVDSSGNPLNATMTQANAQLVFNPIPLDITGITFKAEVRAIPGGHDVFLEITTADGSFINGGTDGALLFKIPAARMGEIDAGNYVMDILGEGDGNVVSLFPTGPAVVVVTQGISEP